MEFASHTEDAAPARRDSARWLVIVRVVAIIAGVLLLALAIPSEAFRARLWGDASALHGLT